MDHERLFREFAEQAQSRLGPGATLAEIVFEASLIFGLAIGWFSGVNTTLH